MKSRNWIILRIKHLQDGGNFETMRFSVFLRYHAVSARHMYTCGVEAIMEAAPLLTKSCNEID